MAAMSETSASAGDPLGFVVEGSTPSIVRFVSKNPPPLGDYIVVDTAKARLLGLVEHVGSRSVTLSAAATIYDPVVVSRIASLAAEEDVFFECRARVLGAAGPNGLLASPKYPPLPGDPVYSAPDELLESIFGSKDPHHVRLGVLAARPNIEVYVDVNKLVTRHLAILAVTGAGKSNTVAVLADRLTELGATILLFDFHGEYVNSTVGGASNLIEAKLNPALLTISELMQLLGIEPRFYNQERILRKAYSKAHSATGGEKGFIERLREAVEQVRREDAKAIAAVLNKIDALTERHGDILDEAVGDVVARIRPGKVNVVDLSRVDEEAADVVVSHFLRRLLHERKRYKLENRGFPVPVLVIIEEAHILAPRERSTLSKYWLSRIAREGRKFGVGLVIVSQRPKSLDQDTLSQTNNKIILRIVEPSDQRYVQAASETLSDDLLEQLPGLNVGEAIVLGPMVPIPVLVKIDKFEGRLGGADPDVVSEWIEYKRKAGAGTAIEEAEQLSSLLGL